jgi:hypothetical protein
MPVRKRTRSFSARFSADVVDRLEAQSRRLGESRARLAERMIEEGLQLEQFPGIIFRTGPTGRRAGIAGGPDVWEIVRDVQRARVEGVRDALGAVARATGLDRSKVELAASYYAAYPATVDERIQMEEEAAERLRRVLGIDPAS